MSQNSKIDLLLGKNVYLVCNDRYETDIVGILIGKNDKGVLLNYQSRSKDLTSFVPYSMIAYIKHKVVQDSKK